jgi:hypothetical protein
MQKKIPVVRHIVDKGGRAANCSNCLLYLQIPLHLVGEIKVAIKQLCPPPHPPPQMLPEMANGHFLLNSKLSCVGGGCEGPPPPPAVGSLRKFRELSQENQK